MRTLVIVCLIGMALAGCTETAPVQTSDDPLHNTEVTVQTTDATGAIKGVVIDETITPIVDATITLLGSGDSTTSDDSGGFGFSDLEPGAYFLEINATGFVGTQYSVSVTAGDIADARVLLAKDFSPVPYHETLQYNGFIGLWAPGGSYAVQLLYQDDTICECQWTFSPSPEVATFVYEAFWEASLEVPTLDQLSWELDSYDEGGLDTQVGEYASSPIFAHVAREQYSPGSFEWLARITPGIGAGVYIQQDYELFITIFYIDAAPEGWTINQ